MESQNTSKKTLLTMKRLLKFYKPVFFRQWPFVLLCSVYLQCRAFSAVNNSWPLRFVKTELSIVIQFVWITHLPVVQKDGLERFKIYTYWESPFKLTKSCTMIKIFFEGWCPELIKQRGLAADHKVRNWPCFVQKYYLCKPNIIITKWLQMI